MNPRPRPTEPLRCHECKHRFGQRSRLYAFPGNGLALCQRCVLTRWQHLHSKYFISCRQPHDPADHGAMLVSPSTFAYLQTNPETIDQTSRRR